MLEYLWSYGARIISFTGEMDRTQWLLLFAGAFVLGIMLMRSGSKYA